MLALLKSEKIKINFLVTICYEKLPDFYSVCKGIGQVELDCRKQLGSSIFLDRRDVETVRSKEGDGWYARNKSIMASTIDLNAQRTRAELQRGHTNINLNYVNMQSKNANDDTDTVLAGLNISSAQQNLWNEEGNIVVSDSEEMSHTDSVMNIDGVRIKIKSQQICLRNISQSNSLIPVIGNDMRKVKRIQVKKVP